MGKKCSELEKIQIQHIVYSPYIYITFGSGLLDEQNLFFVRSDCCRVIFMSEDILTYNKVFILYTYAYYVGSLEYSRIYVAKFYVRLVEGVHKIFR